MSERIAFIVNNETVTEDDIDTISTPYRGLINTLCQNVIAKLKRNDSVLENNIPDFDTIADQKRFVVNR